MENNAAKILIVEDSATQAARLRQVLERHGYAVTAAKDGLEALEAAERIFPALVITDIVMPRMDGYELCSRLKGDVAFRNTPVILLTSLSDTTDVIKGLECGADNLITKPYDEKYLLSRIGSVLANRKLREADGVHVGIDINFLGHQYFISSDRMQILNLLLSTFEAAVQRNRELLSSQDELRALNKQLEQKVRERTEKVREQAALLDITTDAVLVRGMDDTIQFWNRGAELLYGWEAREAIGKKLTELLFRDRAGELDQALQALKEKGAWSGEIDQTGKDGRLLKVEGRYAYVKDESGKPSAVLIVHTDVTEKKRLEASFLRAQRMENIGTLAGGIAHDLNNVLSPILLTTSVLRETKTLDDETRRLLVMIEGNIERGTRMVRQILTFAHGNNGKAQPLPIRQQIRDIEAVIRETFPKNIEMRVRLAADLLPILSEATQFYQVILNLAVNARDAMPEGGVFEITARNTKVDAGVEPRSGKAHPGQYVLIEVSDTGTGMPAEVLDKIFEPFFTTKAPGKGTGLGLSTVARIVAAHGGFLDVSSTPGKGTTFKLYFRAAPQAPSHAKITRHRELPLGSGELILIVDDEAAIRDITRVTLEAHHYKVLCASDGAEAAAIYSEHPHEIRAVITDMGMPFMDGPNTIAALKKMDPKAEIIVASGTPRDEVVTGAIRDPVRGFLQKPYTAGQLLNLLHDVLKG
ncbi:MAG: response regulator [Deltaproteobacteria bacterium]|nr:response regulator [Deltaproteobacteria bacterium]